SRPYPTARSDSRSRADRTMSCGMSSCAPCPRTRLLEAVDLYCVSMADALGDVRLELAEDPPRPREQSIEHRRLEEPCGPDVDADHEAVRHLLDEGLPARIERPRLGRQRRRPLEVHAREVDEEVRIAQQQTIESAGWTLAAGCQDDRALAVRRESPLERSLRLIGELVMDDDRHLELRGRIEDRAEHRRIGIAIDQSAADLAHLDLADRVRLTPLELNRKL